MKTLYINISGENIQSMDDVVVVGKPADDLAYKFYFELGYQILKGVIAPSVKNKRELITEFIQQHKDVYEEKILPQLEQAKRLMLSNDFRGDVKVQLPQEYIQWLNYYGTADYSAIAKSLNERGGIVTINLERIYRNGIQLLINGIEPDDYGQLVVNDDAVEDDTEMVVAIRERLKNSMLPFVLFEEWCKKRKNKEFTNSQTINGPIVNTSKETEDSTRSLDIVIGLESSETVRYVFSGEEHFDTGGNRTVRFCRANGLFLDTTKYIPVDMGKGKTFSCIAINSENEWLCKVDTYGITPICDYSNGIIKNGSHYNGKLSRFNYSLSSKKKARRIGPYLVVEFSDGQSLVYEDKKNKVEISDVELDKIYTLEDQSLKQNRYVNPETEVITNNAIIDNCQIREICCKNGIWSYVDKKGNFHNMPFTADEYRNAHVFSSNLIILSSKAKFDYNHTRNCSLYNIVNNKIFDYHNLESGQILPLSSNYYTVRFWNNLNNSYFNRLYMTDGTFVNEFECDTLFVIE